MTTTHRSADTIPPDNNVYWFEFDFDDITVDIGDLYYIVWGQTGGRENDCVFWAYGGDNPYVAGEAWLYEYGNWDKLSSENCMNPIDFSFKTYGLSGGDNQPPSTPSIIGSMEGKVGSEQEYTFYTTDPDKDTIYYWIDWADGDTEEWIGPYEDEIILTHTWYSSGIYTVRAKAKDAHGAVSGWGSLKVSMPKSKPINNIFLQLLEYYQNLFSLLQRFLGL